MSTGLAAAGSSGVTSTTALIVALIAGAVSLASVWYTRRTQLDVAKEQRRFDAKSILDRCRGPLLDATWELGDRIDKLRNRDFLVFLAEGSARQEDAKLTTLFRFANYFGWREYVRAQVQLLRFEREEETRLVASLLGDVTQILATDSLDDTLAMLWAEEQRGIGELMASEQRDASPVRGHAAFYENYGWTFALWMDPFGKDLLSDKCVEGERLRLLTGALYGLVLCLDEEEAFPRTGWIQRASDEIERRSASSEAPEERTSQIEKSMREHVTQARHVEHLSGRWVKLGRMIKVQWDKRP